MVHCNICPESIIINKNGSWKIAGFDCCIPNSNQQSDPSVSSFIKLHEVIDYHSFFFLFGLELSDWNIEGNFMIIKKQ